MNISAIQHKMHTTLMYAFSYRLNDCIRRNCQAFKTVSAKHADSKQNVLQCFIMKFGWELSNVTRNIAIMIK